MSLALPAINLNKSHFNFTKALYTIKMEIENQENRIDIPTLARTIFVEAANRGASDVHIDPGLHELRIRFRVDGSLSLYTTLPMIYHEQILTHLKVLSDLNTTAVFTPQDGHFAVNFMYQDDVTGKTSQIIVDIRISVFPTTHGDAAVFRLANSVTHILKLEGLGMDEKTLRKVRSITKKNNGMLLITGPVGSGKTSAIYSVLQEVLTPEKNAVTLEDPVEFHFEGVRQIQMNPDRGLTYASGMKSILRQDPDIILIGEIRDAETAEHAARAALVGRIVFSTIHANSSIGTIARLIDMNIEKSVIAYALNGVIACRLVRKNCLDCKVEYKPADELLSLLSVDASVHKFYKGVGCKSCDGKGHSGRTGIFEVIEFDTNMRSMIVEGASMADLQKYVDQSGARSLKEDGLLKVFSGVTTLEDIVAVI
jgi:type IV pilus assembly protein PilB